MTFHLKFVHNSFRLIWVAEWPLFGRELPTRLAVCSHCMSICIVFSRYGFEDGVWFLIGPVPLYCLLVTFCIIVGKM